jgi:hypothetical protein
MTDKPDGQSLVFDAAPTAASAERIRRFDQIPDIMTMEIQPIEYLVDGLIARKTITLWAGMGGTAKSFLAERMAVAVATGSQFLGRRCQQAQVLYLDYENPSFAVRERLDLMAGGPINGLKVWGTWLEQQPPQITNELLLSIAKETKPLIIVDPLRFAHGADENDSTEMSGIMQLLRYCAAAGGAVVILHHLAKTEGSTGRGSTAIRDHSDVAFVQEMSEESGLITLKGSKNRNGELLMVTIRPDFDEGTFEVTDSPKFAKRAEDLDKLRKIITAQPGLSQNSICGLAGMKKARVGQLLKENLDRLWRTQPGPNRSLNYFPVEWFPGMRTTTGTTEPPIEQSAGGSGGSPLKGREPRNHCLPELLKSGSRENLPHCPACGSFALYREPSGVTTCMTCLRWKPHDPTLARFSQGALSVGRGNTSPSPQQSSQLPTKFRKAAAL